MQCYMAAFNKAVHMYINMLGYVSGSRRQTVKQTSIVRCSTNARPCWFNVYIGPSIKSSRSDDSWKHPFNLDYSVLRSFPACHIHAPLVQEHQQHMP